MGVAARHERERHNVSYAFGPGQDHDDAVHAKAGATRWRHPVRDCLKEVFVYIKEGAKPTPPKGEGPVIDQSGCLYSPYIWGVQTGQKAVLANLVKRDRIDSGREVSPLRRMPDAILVDTSHLTIEEQVDIVCDLAHRRIRGVKDSRILVRRGRGRGDEDSRIPVEEQERRGGAHAE